MARNRNRRGQKAAQNNTVQHLTTLGTTAHTSAASSSELKSPSTSPQSPLDLGNGIWSSIRMIEGQDSNVQAQRFEWDSESLKPYGGYRKLLGERKYSSPHPSKPIKGSFLNLPPEIRNRIYRLALLTEPDYIEVAAKTNEYFGSNRCANRHHMRRYKYDIKKRLRLLRVCKQINVEAASIFYGEYEFRFTNCKGWYILDAFLRQIGPKNQALLRQIAVHAPWSGEIMDSWKDAMPESAGRLRWMSGILENMGFRRKHYKLRFTLESCIERSITTLESHGKLTRFRIVVPDSYELSDLLYEYGPRSPHAPDDLWPNLYYDFALDRTKFDRLKIQLVRLHGSFSGMRDEIPHLLGNSLGSTIAVRKQARQEGIEIVEVAYNEKGCWPVPPKEDEPIEEIEEGDWIDM